MSTVQKVIAAAIVVGLTACQQQQSPGNTLALRTALKYAATISRSFHEIQGPSARGIVESRDTLSNFTPINTTNSGYSCSTVNGVTFNSIGGGTSTSCNPFQGVSLSSTPAPMPTSQPWYGNQQWGGNWNNVNGQGVFGNSMMSPNMGDITTQCTSMVNSIPQQIQNLDFMVGSLERCLYLLAINQSGTNAYMMGTQDPSILNYAGYSMDFSRPGQYGNYGYNMYSPFLLNGQTSNMSPSQFPNGF